MAFINPQGQILVTRQSGMSKLHFVAHVAERITTRVFRHSIAIFSTTHVFAQFEFSGSYTLFLRVTCLCALVILNSTIMPGCLYQVTFSAVVAIGTVVIGIIFSQAIELLLPQKSACSSCDVTD